MKVKRSQKFYRDKEKLAMEELGLKVTIASGAGWIEKEDGQNEDIIAQYKYTDNNSYKLNLDDIETLIYNASVAKKIPIFEIEFGKIDKKFLLVELSDFKNISDLLFTDKEVKRDNDFNFGENDSSDSKVIKKIKSGNKNKYWEEENKKWIK